MEGTEQSIDIFLEIVVDIAHAQVDRRFTYFASSDMNLCVGSHVLVPFGRGNKPVEGFVLSITNLMPKSDYTIKSVIRAIEPYPIFTANQLKLAFWMKENYNCLLVDSLRLMIPAQLRGGRVHEKTERAFLLPPGLDANEVRKTLLKRDGTPKSPKQVHVFNAVAERDGSVPMRDLQSIVDGAQAAVQALIKKGLLVESGYVTFRRPDIGGYTVDNLPVELMPAQQSAIHEITSAMSKHDGVFLLHGVTGSGKTEIYMRCIKMCIDTGNSAILLVPEIALTPQTMGLFKARFGDDVAVLHSRLSAGERFDEWRRIRLNRAKVAVGARSAIFAPFEKLGLIIIDEEHEQTYQSESSPRYSAVEVALRRAVCENATLVLGSATPSITSYFRAKSGRYKLLELPERVMGRKMPQIQIVDMRQEFLTGNTGIFSGALFLRLEECLSSGKQAILFLNRRGYSTFVSCRGCGYVFNCTHCDISMTYHKTDELVKCHYCGYYASLPTSCPECGKRYVKYFGVGTQQVEEQLKAHFPGISALRMDLDTTRTKDAHEKMFASFAKGEAQVLIGTQMVAKGLDFPNVTLVGVVAADSTLHLPDYRSAERTFQLLMQVAGRAGRGQSPGAVVVQSFTPAHPSIRFAAAHDYKGFFAHELNARRAAIFPPFSIFIRALLTGDDEAQLIKDSQTLKSNLELAIRQALTPDNEKEFLHISDSPAPIKKRQDVYRYQVLIKLVRTKHTESALKAIYNCVDSCNIRVSLEVNPGELF